LIPQVFGDLTELIHFAKSLGDLKQLFFEQQKNLPFDRVGGDEIVDLRRAGPASPTRRGCRIAPARPTRRLGMATPAGARRACLPEW
jgi:hypothetical protein